MYYYFGHRSERLGTAVLTTKAMRELQRLTTEYAHLRDTISDPRDFGASSCHDEEKAEFCSH